MSPAPATLHLQQCRMAARKGALLNVCCRILESVDGWRQPRRRGSQLRGGGEACNQIFSPSAACWLCMTRPSGSDQACKRLLTSVGHACRALRRRAGIILLLVKGKCRSSACRTDGCPALGQAPSQALPGSPQRHGGIFCRGLCHRVGAKSVGVPRCQTAMLEQHRRRTTEQVADLAEGR